MPLPEGVQTNTTVYADKGYDGKANREHLQERKLIDGIMRKGKRGIPLAQAERARNIQLGKTRYVIEQSFGTLHRKFSHKRARYFGLVKVAAQSHLKAICVNLLKAGNRIEMCFCA